MKRISKRYEAALKHTRARVRLSEEAEMIALKIAAILAISAGVVATLFSSNVGAEITLALVAVIA
jgi:uncharacterized membrane protein